MTDTIKLTEVTDVITPDAETDPENYNFSIESRYTESYIGDGTGRTATFLVASSIDNQVDFYNAIKQATGFDSFYCVNQSAIPDTGGYVRSMVAINGAGGVDDEGAVSTTQLYAVWRRNANKVWGYISSLDTAIAVNANEEFFVSEIMSYTGA